MKIKISGLDKLYSHYIRWIRDKGVCQRCKKQYQPPTNALHCSHFWGRGKKSTRFDPENTCAICYGCHRYLTAHPNDHREFWLKRLGQRAYDLLMLRANTPGKPDYKAIKIWLKMEIKNADPPTFGRVA